MAESSESHQQRASKLPAVYDENGELPAPGQIGIPCLHSGKPVKRTKNVNEEEVDTREYDVERSIGHTEKIKERIILHEDTGDV